MNSAANAAVRTLPVAWQHGSCAVFRGCWSKTTCHPFGHFLLSNTGSSENGAPSLLLWGRQGNPERTRRGVLQWELAARCAGSPDPKPSQRLLATHCAGRQVPRDRWPVMAKPIGGTACADETHPAPQRLKANSYFRNKTTLCFAPFDTY